MKWLNQFFMVVCISLICITCQGDEYSIKDIDYEWAQNTDNILDEDPDPNSGWINIGFDFPFFDRTYDKLWISKKGIICFGEITSYDNNLNQIEQIPSDHVLNYTRPKISAFWDDLDAGG